MSDPIRNVSLSFPCRENWDKFEVVAGGRLCASCQHIVRDFRDCSAAELQEAMKSGQRVCGRFKKEQLAPAFLKAAIVAVSVATTACQAETPTPLVEEFKAEELVLPDTLHAVEFEEIITLGFVISDVDTVKIDN